MSPARKRLFDRITRRNATLPQSTLQFPLFINFSARDSPLRADHAGRRHVVRIRAHESNATRVLTVVENDVDRFRSLGVTTYVLLTGFSPFGGETDQETFQNISLGEVDFPEELFGDISTQAKDFVAKLLVLDPRYADRIL